MKHSTLENKKYTVYILQCADSTLYCGCTSDIARRVIEHNTSNLGAKYTKARRPVKLVYIENVATMSEAQKREYQIKQLSRTAKFELIKTKKLKK